MRYSEDMQTSSGADGPTVHVLDSEKLLVGDIVVTRSPKSPMSELIQAVTGSEYSHAMVITTPPMAVESTRRGVTRFKISRLMIRDRDSIRVLRLRDRHSYDQALRHVARRADAAVAREYATADAVLSILAAVPQVEKGRYFCSQLVADVYAREGIALLPGTDPAKVTPGMLLSSPLLRDITNEVLRVPSFVEFVFAEGLVDGDFESIYQAEIEIRQHLAKTLVNLLKEYNFNVTSVDEAIAVVLAGHMNKEPWCEELDNAVHKAFHESGLVDFWKQGIPEGIYHFDLDVVDFIRTEPEHVKVLGHQLLELYKGMLSDKLKAVEYWEKDVQQLYQVVVYITGRESVYFTLLRMSEDRLWATYRLKETLRRTVEIVAHAISVSIVDNNESRSQ